MTLNKKYLFNVVLMSLNMLNIKDISLTKHYYLHIINEYDNKVNSGKEFKLSVKSDNFINISL